MVTNHGCAPCLRRQAKRHNGQARTRVALPFWSGWIFSFSFRLTQRMLDIFSFQGCLQTIGFLPPLHKYLHDYKMMQFWSNGTMLGDLYYKQFILFFLSLSTCPLFQYSNHPSI